jgi:hypothetical protein
VKKFYGLSAFVVLEVVLAGFASKPLRAYMTAKSLSAVDNSIVAHRWGSPNITWQMNPVQGTNVTGSRQQSDVLNASFGAWAAFVPITVTQGANTASTVQVPQYDGINCITTNPAPGALPTGVLAYTFTYYFNQPGVDPLGRSVSFAGQIMEADMEFSNQYPLSLNAAAVPNAIDFQSVATHEAGHFLGMDHASDVSSTMFWTTGLGYIYQRNLSADDIAGISTLYPPANYATLGTLNGTVRTMGNVAVYGAIVVAVNANGQPVASTVTDPSGNYSIQGLPPGPYTVFAEPLAGRISPGNIATLSTIYSGTVNAYFTTRYH